MFFFGGMAADMSSDSGLLGPSVSSVGDMGGGLGWAASPSSCPLAALLAARGIITKALLSSGFSP